MERDEGRGEGSGEVGMGIRRREEECGEVRVGRGDRRSGGEKRRGDETFLI